MNKLKHEQVKELVLLIGGLILVSICIAAVAFLLYSSNNNGNELPQYAITFFSSITTLILGYLFGKFIGGQK